LNKKKIDQDEKILSKEFKSGEFEVIIKGRSDKFLLHSRFYRKFLQDEKILSKEFKSGEFEVIIKGRSDKFLLHNRFYRKFLHIKKVKWKLDKFIFPYINLLQFQVKSEQLDESFFNPEKDCRKVQVIKANFRVNNWIRSNYREFWVKIKLKWTLNDFINFHCKFK
jgi:hypothetical protein